MALSFLSHITSWNKYILKLCVEFLLTREVNVNFYTILLTHPPEMWNAVKSSWCGAWQHQGQPQSGREYKIKQDSTCREGFHTVLCHIKDKTLKWTRVSEQFQWPWGRDIASAVNFTEVIHWTKSLGPIRVTASVSLKWIEMKIFLLLWPCPISCKNNSTSWYLVHTYPQPLASSYPPSNFSLYTACTTWRLGVSK